MAALVAGGLDALARYPFVLNYVNPISAFKHNAEALQRLTHAAERDIPSIYICGNGRGTTAPFTTAGAIALGNAGQLAGLVLSQLVREGSPFLRNNGRGGGLDFRTMMDVYAVPDPGPFGWDLAHRYGQPIFGTAGCTDAKLFDAQAAAEAALSLFANAVGGANLIHDCGYMNGGVTGSLELVALCDEIVGWLRRFLRPLDITEESLALDLIHQVGPDGNFLETEHTLRHCREDWQPTLMDRHNYEAWQSAGATTLQERANRKVRRLLETHRAESLPADIAPHLDEYLREHTSRPG
jgi:trimethylamine--corrinoid protein Co-methyltransferase